MKSEILNSKSETNPKLEIPKMFWIWNLGHWGLPRNFRDRREREVGEGPVPSELITQQIMAICSRKYGVAHSNLTSFGMVR